MQIVIEIPEEQYITLNAKSQDEILTVVDNALLINAIKNGIPLDKIKAEIETDLSHFCFDDWGNENTTWKEVKAIIDKYRAEGSGEE